MYLIRNIYWIFLSLSLLASATGIGVQVGSTAVDVRSLIDQALRNYVQHSPSTLKGVVAMGSWVTGSNYRSPLISPDPSDHDMTPIFDSQKMSRSQMIEEWKRMQHFMRQQIKASLKRKFPGASSKQIRKILRSVNIYPPDQIVADIVDEKDAARRFAQLKATPNLGGAPVEGTWGISKKPFTQFYAQSAGRTYFKDIHGVVRRGFSDLDNLAAGYGKFTLQATSELCEQFSKKIQLAITEGRGADALKNLKRLNHFLRKAKSRSGLVGFEATNPRLLQAIGNAEDLDLHDAQTMSHWLKENHDLLQKGLSHADEQLFWIKEVASLDDAAQIKFVQSMRADKMRRFLSWAKGLQAKINKAAGKSKTVVKQLPWGKLFKTAVALGTAIEIYNAAALYQSDGWDAANQSLSRAVLGLIPSAILGQIALDYATEVGYDMASAHQDCLDLMAGIYETQGRQHVGQGEQIDALAKRCVDETCVAEAVGRRAQEASYKQLGKESYAGVKSARAIRDRLMGRCLPVVLKAWKGERYALLTRVIKDKDAIDRLFSGAMMVLHTRSSRVGDEVKIHAEPQFLYSQKSLLAMLRRMEHDLKMLGGPEQLGRLYIKENYRWTVQRFDHRQGRWITLQQLPAHTRQIHPRSSDRKDLGDLEPFEMRLPYGATYRVRLDYNLLMVPGLMAEDWQAPEVKEFHSRLRDAYRLKAAAILETARWHLNVTGPSSLSAGTTGTLSAHIEGSPPWADDPGFTTRIRWEKLPGKQTVGWGERLTITAPESRQATYRAVLVGTMGGREVPLGEALHTLSVRSGHATLLIQVIDEESGSAIPDALWDIRDTKGHTIAHTGSELSRTLPPGTYYFTIESSGYMPFTATLKLAAGMRYKKRVKLLPLHVAEVTIIAKDKTTGEAIPGAKWKIEDANGYREHYTGGTLDRAFLPGRYHFFIEAQGYRPFDGTLTFKEGKSYKKAAKLIPIVTLERIGQSTERAPGAQPSKARTPCGKYIPIVTKEVDFTLSVGSESATPPPSAAQTYRIKVDGPGSLRVSITASGKHQCSSNRYGDYYRNKAYVVLEKSDEMGFAGGKLSAGGYFPGVVNKGKGTKSWQIKRSGTITMRLFPESGKGKSVKGTLKCWSFYGNCSGCTRFALPGRVELTVSFKRACD